MLHWHHAENPSVAVHGAATGPTSDRKKNWPGQSLATYKTPPLRVLSSCDRPENAYASVYYEGRWFWIDKRDFASKRTMAYLLVLLALADTGPKESLPVITIQAN
ncbi:MAG: hypothetical protein U0795_06785 [Pirellulales bacterium]